MIYLDYAANTPVDDRVLSDFVTATEKYIANANSRHSIGMEAREKIEKCSMNIANYFRCDSNNIIYTSGSSESNNLVIKGIASMYKDKGRNIIISSLEHSSIVAPCNYLVSLGFDVNVISIDKNGKVNLDELRKTINSETILVSICSVDSELGTIQPIEEIAKIVKGYPKCVFHTDATQAIGKVNIDFTDVDFVTFAPHKFYGLNGFGCLVNRSNIKLIPLIHGGRSTTVYRSGTPTTANIVACDTAFTLAINNLEEREKYIKGLNKVLRDCFDKYSCVHINSPEDAIANILNISLIGIDNLTVVDELEKKEIYLSTTTACSLSNAPSKSVLSITGSSDLASNTLRISISHLTSLQEIYIFLKEFDNIISKKAH